MNFVLRLQVYNLLINQFDSIDCKFNIILLSPKQYKLKVMFSSDILISDMYKEYHAQFLSLEYNFSQRFKFQAYKSVQSTQTFHITLRKSSFFIFLDMCINFIFITKNFVILKYPNYWMIIILDLKRHNSSNFLLWSLLTQRKKTTPITQQIKIYTNDSFLYNYWIPYKNKNK